MNGHHLILGKLVDYLNGETLVDTHDERYRQSLAKMLVERKGYRKTDLRSRQGLKVSAGDKCAQIQIDFAVVLHDRIVMIIRYGPGSLVTRHRPSIAASRLMAPFQIPVVVVTNGQDADVLDGRTGEIISRGIDSIPSRQVLRDRTHADSLESISPESVEREQRILYAYDIDDSCPCDDTICRL